MNETTVRRWSNYQEDIFEAVASSEESLIIEAVAGSGKTTTIVEAIRHVPSSQSIAFLAFNKSIADELKRRVTVPNARCMTLHSAGFAAWRKFAFPDDPKVDSRIPRSREQVSRSPRSCSRPSTKPRASSGIACSSLTRTSTCRFPGLEKIGNVHKRTICAMLPALGPGGS